MRRRTTWPCHVVLGPGPKSEAGLVHGMHVKTRSGLSVSPVTLCHTGRKSAIPAPAGGDAGPDGHGTGKACGVAARYSLAPVSVWRSPGCWYSGDGEQKTEQKTGRRGKEETSRRGDGETGGREDRVVFVVGCAWRGGGGGNQRSAGSTDTLYFSIPAQSTKCGVTHRPGYNPVMTVSTV